MAALVDAKLTGVLFGISLLTINLAEGVIVGAVVVIAPVGEVPMGPLRVQGLGRQGIGGHYDFSLTIIGKLELSFQGLMPLLPALISSGVNLRYATPLCAISGLPDNRLEHCVRLGIVGFD